ncbi:hypothetical protein [Dyella tabacisoli]|nr:hypothetical protein [Dyella tabacisoli]
MSKLSTVKRVVFASVVLFGCAVAAPAFARTHISVGIGIGGPAYYGGGWGGYGYARPVYYPGPVYYRPAPRVVYYDDPVVVERPVYVRRVYEDRVIYRDGYRHRRYRGDDDD